MSLYLVQVPDREPIACGSYALCVCISLDMDVCAALAVECGSHSKCVASPDDDGGYMCVQQSSFSNKSYTIELVRVRKTLRSYCVM